MTTWIGLLRGINVGGNNKIKMADLRAMLESLGLEGAQTLLQSGNVVFRSSAHRGSELEHLLEKETEARLGVRCDYMVRSAEEWEAVIAGNPFPEEAKSDPSHLLVVVSKESPDPAKVAALTDSYRGPEQIKLVGEFLYITFPEGIGRSKLVAFPAYQKSTARGTGRNWNTVLKLASLTKGGHASS